MKTSAKKSRSLFKRMLYPFCSAMSAKGQNKPQPLCLGWGMLHKMALCTYIAHLPYGGRACDREPQAWVYYKGDMIIIVQRKSLRKRNLFIVSFELFKRNYYVPFLGSVGKIAGYKYILLLKCIQNFSLRQRDYELQIPISVTSFRVLLDGIIICKPLISPNLFEYYPTLEFIFINVQTPYIPVVFIRLSIYFINTLSQLQGRLLI